MIAITILILNHNTSRGFLNLSKHDPHAFFDFTGRVGGRNAVEFVDDVGGCAHNTCCTGAFLRSAAFFRL